MTKYYLRIYYERFNCKPYLLVLLQTSFSIANILYYMAKNPDKQQKLFEELQRYVPDKEQPVTSQILNELNYLKACIKESMRYHQNTVECSG
jgi:cytochrome P450